jgi:Mn-dependent DtxR family transcriptional regulator
MKYHDSIEMYLETIYLLENQNGHAHVAEISKAMNISMPSVTKAMGILKQRYLINKSEYGPINLTDEGREMSRKILEKHVLLTRFFELSLGLSHAEAQENACRMEHVVTDKLMDAVKAYLK